ncbi:hypothetical protein ILUMI_22359 [Ignelater luminosus]|uniref:VWFC domain-containing protein n=1 Tax=Ignelater luminosus TaxID=2038154 RepID=A0A8K0G301_IGNLU|nr:hypothetical protein ILUMI_22359 [Ignelater luminosus]
MIRNLKVHLLYLIAVFVIFKNISGKPKNQKCKTSGTLLYEDMACKPITKASRKHCPTSYNCDHLYENWCEGSERCTLKGRTYGSGDKIPHEETKHKCQAGCFCKAFPSVGASINCALMECPQFIGPQQQPENCYYKWDLDDPCCPTGDICPPFDNVTKCMVDGRIYLEGERFNPANTCLNCVCKKGYNGRNKTPFCEKMSCYVELSFPYEIREFCAPVYNRKYFCCPIIFLCPPHTEMALDLKVPPSSEECDKLGILLYEEIGCKPIKNNPNDPCASSYDCKHLEEKEEHCSFQGKKYKDREGLPDDAIRETCSSGCFCNADKLGSQFTCAAFDCPEFIGGSPLEKRECIRTYQLGGCCSHGQICPPFNNTATCKVDGITYLEGQRFSSKKTCSNCVCQKGFTGKYETPYCKRDSCAVELRHANDIKNKCAPVYNKNNVRCCPQMWVCPSESDIFSPAQKETAFIKTCKFGEKEIKNGQVLQTNLEKYGQKYEIKCDCQLPPLLTCIVLRSENIKH